MQDFYRQQSCRFKRLLKIHVSRISSAIGNMT